MAEKQCECGHPVTWHHQFQAMPCGSGGCECRAWREAVTRPAKTVIATDLFGEVREMPTETA